MGGEIEPSTWNDCLKPLVKESIEDLARVKIIWHPTDIHKIKREKRKKKCEDMSEIASPLKIKRKTKSHIPTIPKDLPESRERHQMKERVRSYQKT